MHPRAWAVTGPECWGNIWSEVLDSVARDAMAGVPSYRPEELFFITRTDTSTLDEVYFTWSFSGIGGDQMEGVWNSLHDTSDKVLAQRRLAVIKTLSSYTCTCFLVFRDIV